MCLEDLKTLSFSCLASLYLLCSAQANDSRADLLHSYTSLFREICKKISQVIIHDWYMPLSLVMIVKQ